MNCPYCGNNLKVKLEKAPATKKRIKKDPNEPMTADQFIDGCWANKQRHIQIIGHYADELKLNGEYKTRGQWNVFLKRNVASAIELANFDDDQISDAMKKLHDVLKTNGGYIDKFTLETVSKFLVK